MNDREANIDLLFRNGLSDYEALPPSDIWEGIKPVIARPGRSLIFLRIAAAVAFMIASGLLTAMLVRNMPSGSENPAVTLVRGTIAGNLQNEKIMNPGQAILLPVIAKTEEDPVTVEDEELPVNAAPLFNLPSPGLYTSFIKNGEKNFSTRDNKGNNQTSTLQKAYNPSFSDIEKDVNVQVKEKIPEKDNRWSVGAMVSPAYYSQFNLSQDDAANDLISSEEAAFSYTGGLTFAYNLNRRFTVQTGISYSSIGQKIDGVISYSGFGRYFESKGGSEFEVMTSTGTIAARNNDIFLFDDNSGSRVMSMFTPDVFDPVKNKLSYISSSLTQNFNYIEVPVVLKYKFIDRNVDLKIIGGVSYNVLVNNSAFTTDDGTRYYVGKTEGLSPVTLSSSLGMGMEYNFSGKLSLNLEPTFRYYMTPMGGLAGSSIHPYSFGILSGISYKF